MQLTPETKKVLLIFLFIFFIAWSLTSVYFITHVEYIPEGWAEWHQTIADGQSPDSTQFRLLSYWMADGMLFRPHPLPKNTRNVS